MILSEKVTFELSTERQEVSMWSLGEESSGWEGSIHWTRGGFKLILRPSAFGLESVRRPVFLNKLSKWKVLFSVAKFGVAVSFSSFIWYEVQRWDSWGVEMGF